MFTIKKPLRKERLAKNNGKMNQLLGAEGMSEPVFSAFW
jgi:hypothetical protein